MTNVSGEHEQGASTAESVATSSSSAVEQNTVSAGPTGRGSRPRRIGAGLLGLAIVGGAVMWMVNRSDQSPQGAGDSAQELMQTVEPKAASTPSVPVAKCDGVLRDPFDESKDGGAVAAPGLIVVPAGEFQMGETPSPEGDRPAASDAGPVRQVRIARPLAVSACEIRTGEFAAFADETGRSWPSARGGNPELSAAGMSWDDAVAFTEWLSEKTGQVYRLLSEAEWEYVARAGAVGRWPVGDDPSLLCIYAKVREDVPTTDDSVSCEADRLRPGLQVAASRKANRFGLYDTIGNVAEWTADCYRPNYQDAPVDGTAVDERRCAERVYRGGSWLSTAEFARPAFRAHAAADYRDYFLGFRVAREIDADEIAKLPAPGAMVDLEEAGAVGTASARGPARIAYLRAKAWLADELIARAWTLTVRGEKEVRPWPWAEMWPIARLRADELGVDLHLLHGDTGSTLAFGPGHVPGSATPGDEGNAVLLAHRNTHFAFLRRMTPGMELTVERPDGRSTRYVVAERRIVNVRYARFAVDTDAPTLTLVTCYPFDAPVPGGPLRYVVTARELGFGQR